MFKVKKTETCNKTFRFPVELLHQLEEYAQQEKESVNYLVIQCCEYALKHRYDGTPENNSSTPQ